MANVSIFIRVKNEAQALEKTLLAIKDQEESSYEVIVLDNESTDDTCLIAQKYGASVEKMSSEEFSYGRALNKSLKYTQGEIVVFLSAHSPPCDNHWLSELIKPIQENRREVTFGRQVPIAGLNVFEEWFVRRGFPRKPNAFLKLIGFQKITFSNANAAISKKLLQIHPFNEQLAFAEDIEWSERIMRQGIQIEYCPKASVYHSHVFKQMNDLYRRMIHVGQAMKMRNQGQVYRNPISYGLLYLATMGVDFFYCLFQGYWGEMGKICAYRKAFFEGIREGLGSTTRKGEESR